METLGGICVGLDWLPHLLLRLAAEEDDDVLFEVDFVSDVRSETVVASVLGLPILIFGRLSMCVDHAL